jgi:hypothetical protein
VVIEYFCGLDLGQASDYTALAIVEAPYWIATEDTDQLNRPSGWSSPAEMTSSQRDRAWSLNYHQGVPEVPTLTLRQLKRFPLRTPYPTIVEAVAETIHRLPLREGHTALIVDQTGVGRPVVDLLRQADCQPIGVTITGGSTVSMDQTPHGREYGVPKRDLVSTMAVTLEQGRLVIPDRMPEADALTKELQNFKRKVTPVGNDTYAGRESAHDDMVLAVALAVWYRQHWNQHLDVANSQRQLATAEAVNGVGPWHSIVNGRR